MSQIIQERLAAVRAEMAKSGLDAFIVPRADEYLGEYVPERNERLRWLSGFSGSAGMAIVLKDRAVIFVDGRYTVQVRQQVSAELIKLPPAKPEVYCWGASKALVTRDPPKGGYSPNFIWS